MSPILVVADSPDQYTQTLVTFMRYCFKQIGYKYELRADA